MPSGPRKRRAARRKKEMENAATLLPSDDPPKDGERREDLMLHESRQNESQSPPYSSAPSSPFVESQPPSRSEAVDCVADSSKDNLKAACLAQQDEQDASFAVKEAVLLPTDASDAKSELFAQSFEESVIFIEKIVSLPEDRSQVTEVPIAVKEVVLLPTNAPQAKPDDFVESENEDKKPSEKSAISVKDITALPKESSQFTEVAANDQRLNGAQPHDANGIIKQDGETHEACQVAREEKTLPASEALHHAPLVVHHTKLWNCCGLLDIIMGRDT